MNLKKLNNCALVLVVFFAGCAGPRVQLPLSGKAGLKTLKSAVMVSYASPSEKIKKRSLLAVKGDSLLRFEIKGFFNEPFFMLVARGKIIQAYFVAENAYFEGELFDADSDNPASVFINNSGKLKLKATRQEITSLFTLKNTGSGIPATADLTAGEHKVTFTFLDPELDIDLPDSLFEMLIPKKARRISEQELSRYLLTWKK